METKAFSVVTTISMVLILTVATLSIIGVAITGLYPGIIVLVFVTLIPIVSKFYAKKISSKSNGFQRNYYTTLTIINLLSILVVLWMTFVIVHDRVLHDCCWFLPGGILTIVNYNRPDTKISKSILPAETLSTKKSHHTVTLLSEWQTDLTTTKVWLSVSASNGYFRHRRFDNIKIGLG